MGIGHRREARARRGDDRWRCDELGIPRNDDFNGATQEGAGYYQLTTRRGLRCSTAVAYLNPARSRSNLRIETNAHATRVLVRRHRARRASRIGRPATSSLPSRGAKCILAAGALQSPQLLQLSGVGPPALLQQHGIPVVHALDGVGENLQDHLQARVIFRCTQPDHDERHAAIVDAASCGWGSTTSSARRGPMAVGINQGGIFARAMPDATRPDVQFHFATLSSDMAGSPVHTFSGFTMSVCQLRPTSRGTVRIRSRDALEPPAMQPHYLSTAEDRATLVAGMRLARSLAATRAMRPFVDSEYRPGDGAVTDDDAARFRARTPAARSFIRAARRGWGRPTMRAASSIQNFACIGLAGLRVVDCGIMPTLVSGNTNVPVVMIAEKAAAMILAEPR